MKIYSLLSTSANRLKAAHSAQSHNSDNSLISIVDTKREQECKVSEVKNSKVKRRQVVKLPKTQLQKVDVTLAPRTSHL
jgi:hypothetical protein